MDIAEEEQLHSYQEILEETKPQFKEPQTETLSIGLLPPIRAPIRSKAISQVSKSVFQDSAKQHITNKMMQYSIKKKMKNDKVLQDYLQGQKQRSIMMSMDKSLKKIDKSSEVFKSTKVGKMTKIKPHEIRPALKAFKIQYKIRQESIAKYLSDPKILQQYKMLSHLGKGGFSIVTLAVNKQTNKRYAIKTYSKIDEIQDYKFDNIYREINHLHALSHQNIVGLFHVVKDKRKLLLVMEDGGKLSLAGLMRKNKTLPETMAKNIFRQILQGVQYCHENKISHRDLKLENILVDGDNTVKLIDFGFSSKCGQKLQNYCGTPPYMAPQITAKIPYHGEPADMWALGILLYYMLYGKFPFRANTETELYRIIQQGKFQLAQGITQQAKQAITKLLKCSTKDRATAGQISNCSWLRN